MGGSVGARRPTQSPGARALLAVTLLAVFGGACTGVINPPIFTATAIPTVSPTATEIPPTATPVPERWLKNHRIAEMWSGPARDGTAISFGQTSDTFCSFRIVRADDNGRILVYNPYSDGEFWIDADAVGPVVPPERRRGPRPPDQNCAEAVYDR